MRYFYTRWKFIIFFSFRTVTSRSVAHWQPGYKFGNKRHRYFHVVGVSAKSSTEKRIRSHLFLKIAFCQNEASVVLFGSQIWRFMCTYAAAINAFISFSSRSSSASASFSNSRFVYVSNNGTMCTSVVCFLVLVLLIKIL